MKKRFTAFSLTFVMLIGQIFGSGMTVLAGDGSNAYGHTVTYQPVTQLYTAGEPIRFFDAQVTDWGTLSEKITRDEANSIKWLSENGYLLNHFGRKIEASGDNTNRYTDGCFNSKGEWQTKLQGPSQTSNGQNYTSVNLTKLDGHLQMVKEDLTKNSSSYRSLPLVAPVKKLLLEKKQSIQEYRKLFRRSYYREDSDYVCVNEIGELIKPRTLSDKAGEGIRTHDDGGYIKAYHES